MKQMDGKVVLLTGGGGGIARGISEAFAEQGANLFLTDIVQQGMDATSALVTEKYGSKVVTSITDGSKEEEVKAAIERCISEFGKLDCLINCACGGNPKAPLLETETAKFDACIQANLHATFYYMKYAYPHLKEAHGAVINFASGAGIGGNPNQAAYAAAKEGIRGLSRVAAHEWGLDDITVNVVCPLVMTPALAKFKEEHPEAYAKNVKLPPVGRFGDSKNDIGKVCVFLASDSARYITGETFNLQGGLNSRP